MTNQWPNGWAKGLAGKQADGKYRPRRIAMAFILQGMRLVLVDMAQVERFGKTL